MDSRACRPTAVKRVHRAAQGIYRGLQFCPQGVCRVCNADKGSPESEGTYKVPIEGVVGSNNSGRRLTDTLDVVLEGWAYQKAGLYHVKQPALQILSSQGCFADPGQAIAHRCCLPQAGAPVGCTALHPHKAPPLHWNDAMQGHLQTSLVLDSAAVEVTLQHALMQI